MNANKQYTDLLQSTLETGDTIRTRNSVVRRVAGVRAAFSSAPLISARKTAWKLALREMEWFLSGSSNVQDLHPSVRHWWEPWKDASGCVSNSYSDQFSSYRGQREEEFVDQVNVLIFGVSEDPFSRRHVITTWHTADMIAPETKIANCHGTVIQCVVSADHKLDLITYQRSADLICGLPHNWIQYWALLMWLASRTGTDVGRLVWMGGDVHLYEAHTGLAERIVASQVYAAAPDLIYTPTTELFRAEDFTLSGEYQPIITEKAEMIV